jgi:hypothetical protein
MTVTPPSMTLTELWSALTYQFGMSFGSSWIFGFLLLAVLTFGATMLKGFKGGLVFILMAIPIFATMGLIPSWLRFIDYVLVAILVALWYREVTQ